MRKILSRMGAAVRGFGFKQWFMTALIAALLLASAASLIGLGVVRRALVSVTAAERFRGGTDVRFAQIGCFLPVGQGKTEEDIFKFRQTLDSKLVEQSLEAPENGSLYLDAYCGMGTVTAVGNNGVSASVGAIGVGGDFFFFHPLVLRSGSYIQGGDLMDDLVVLDEETAWKLFGAVDLAGMPMTINGKDFVVSGVAAREDDFATKKAYGGDSGIFMSYSALSRLLEDTDISCYELVMPDPISGFAQNLVKENFSVGSGDIVENSSRYALGHLWQVIRDFGNRSMRTNGVIYPYWENAARLTEDYAAIFLFAALLTGFVPACCAVVLTVRTVIRTYRFLKKRVPEKVDAAVEKRREERLEKVYAQKNAGEEQPWQS